MEITRQQIEEAAAFVRKEMNPEPDSGIILGTGLGALVEEIDIISELSYKDIPHFPVSTVETHAGKLIYGTLGDVKILAMQGRFHYYEGYSMQQVTMPVRVMKLLGIKKLFISNAAGGISPHFELSDLMILEDHINLMPENPLRGHNDEFWGSRFPDMYEAYDKGLIARAEKLAKEMNIKVHKGVYAAVSGPNLETPSEYRYIGIIGADAVGMSTVPENIVAHHMGLPVFAISVITDLCSPDKLKSVSVPEVIRAAMNAEPAMTKLLKELVKEEGA